MVTPPERTSRRRAEGLPLFLSKSIEIIIERAYNGSLRIITSIKLDLEVDEMDNRLTREMVQRYPYK